MELLQQLLSLSLYEMLSLVISIAGFVAVIVTLVILTRQTREMSTQTKYVAESLKSSAYGNVTAQVLKVDELFIEHPELRPYFYSSTHINENDSAYNKAISTAELILDVFDSVLLQTNQFPQVWPHNWWEEYVMDSFANSPILCEYLNVRKDWYSGDLKVLMQRGLERRQQKNTHVERQAVA